MKRNVPVCVKGELGFVFQSFNLIDELNVYENVELPLTYLNISEGFGAHGEWCRQYSAADGH